MWKTFKNDPIPAICLIGLFLFSCPKPTPDPVYPTNADAGADDSEPIPCATYNGKYRVMDTVLPATIEPGCMGKPSTDVLTVQVIEPQDPDSGQWDVVVLTASGERMVGLATSYEHRRVACRFVVELRNPFSDVSVNTRDFILGETELGKGRGEATIQEGSCSWQSSSVLQRVP